jgi:CRISPR-associated protein Cmr5
MSGRKSIERERMQAAYDIGHNKNYKNKINKLPAMLHTNGVGNTIAFISQKSEWDLVYKDISYYLVNNSNIPFKQKIGTDLMKCVKELKDDELKILQLELFAFINWLRRFAKGD